MRRITPALAAALVIVVGACDESGTVTDVGPEAPGPDAPDASDTLPVEPTLEVDHGVYSLTFVEDDDGVAVVEYAPADAPPLLDVLVAEDATALEILRAVSPNVEAPAALVRAHQESDRVSAATGVRDLSALIEPATSTGGVAFDLTTFYDGADCSYSSDLAYFKAMWQFLGWNWRWYKNWKPATDWYYSARTPPTKYVRAHTCNNARNISGNEYTWGVYRRSSATCEALPFTMVVYPGHRGVFHGTTPSKKCRYESWVKRYYGPMVKHGLGIMKP